MTSLLNDYGVKRTNTRWSWGGIDENGEVWITLWWDMTRGNKSYLEDPVGLLQSKKDLLMLYRHAKEHHNGRFHGLMSIARDVHEHPRKVKTQYRSGMWRFTSFDEATYSFTAERVPAT